MNETPVLSDKFGDGVEFLTEHGLSILRQIADNGAFEVRLEGEDLVLYTVYYYEDRSGEDIELGKISLYHAAGYTAGIVEDALDLSLDEKRASLFEIAGIMKNSPIHSKT